MPQRLASLSLMLLALPAICLGQSTDDEQGFLGVRVKNLERPGGEIHVAITEIVPASPAEKAGFKVGDIVRKVANVEAKDYDTVVDTIRMFKPGDRISVEITRDDRELTIHAVLTKRPKDP